MNTHQFDQDLLNYLVLGVKEYAIFALNTDGNVATWNVGAERTKGYIADEIVGKHFSVFYPEDVRIAKHYDIELAKALEQGSYEVEGWRVRKDGSRFWAHSTLTTLYDAEGKHIGFANVVRDLSEQRANQENRIEQSDALRQSEDVFKQFVSSVKDYAIFMLSPEGIVKTWNAGAERIKGYTADEIVGKHFSTFYTDEEKNNKHPDFELQEAISKGSYEEEGWRIRKDGSQFWANVTITSVKQNDQLKGFIKVTRDLSEKKKFSSDLEKARDEAVLANQIKSKFVTNITHEIRTPLSGIVGLSELIKDHKDATEEIKDSGQRIFDASRHLLGLLNDLLDFAKLEAGKMELQEAFQSIEVIVDEVIGLSEPKAEEKGLQLTTSIDKDLPTRVMIDGTKLRQILLNLVNNSIKFTESGGIEISVEKEGDSMLFSVTDTGIGIAPEVQGKLFMPFIQGHDSSYGGTGLGLSISHQFVELMGGQIGMESIPNEGTTVWFSLPIKQKAGSNGRH